MSYDDDLDDEVRPRRPRGKSGAWLVPIVTSAVTSVLVVLVVMPRVPVSEAVVPPLAGLGVEQARGVLSSHGLFLSIDGERPDERSEPGALIEETPLPGSSLARGSAVHAFLAVRPPRAAAPIAQVTPIAPAPPPLAAPTAVAPAPRAEDRVTPSVVGKRLSRAREIIAQSGFSVGAVRFESDNDVGPDKVLRQSPAAGTHAARAVIDLVVNSD